MPVASTGVCPNCEVKTGTVGERCPSEVCAAKGYGFIPLDWFESARAFARRKGRPLDPLLGRSLSRYLLVGLLGEGGMGSVYLALQRPLGREVALKLISGLDPTPALVARFEREAMAVSLLEHPNIVKLHDYGVGEGDLRLPFMALEYVRHGRTMRRALSGDNGPVTVDAVRSVFEQVLHALAAAHEAGIVHRDMKPENVLVVPVHGNPLFVKVLDFGLARAVSEVAGFGGTLSRDGHLLGTPLYMAPEQAPRKGRVEVDGRADLYAVATMLFEAVTGVPPYDGESPLAILAQKVDPEHRPLDSPAASRLPEALRAFLARGMARDPAARFQTAAEMLSALRGALSGGVVAGFAGEEVTSSRERAPTPPTPTTTETLAAVGPASAVPVAAEANPPGTRVARPISEEHEKGAVHVATETPAASPVPSPALDRRIGRRPVLAFVGVLTVAIAAAVVGLSSRDDDHSGEAKAIEASSGRGGQGPGQADQRTETADQTPGRGGTDSGQGVRPTVPGGHAAGPQGGATSARIHVRFNSEPAGAEVLLAGRSLGTTPFEMDLVGPAGAREFVIRKDGWKEATVTREVADGALVEARLEPATRSPSGRLEERRAPGPTRRTGNSRRSGADGQRPADRFRMVD